MKQPLTFLLCGLLLSCQNTKVEEIVNESDLPIRIDNRSHIQTRTTGTNFESNDEIGLYVLKLPNNLTNDRHVDNMRFMYSEGSWIPDNTIYYPSMTDLCDFIAYYPYRATALATASSALEVKVSPNQSNPTDYNKNDFLVAERTSITPSNEPVPLLFKHKLAEIHIEIDPGTGYNSVEELKAANPTVLIRDVATHTTYDFLERNFSNTIENTNITPAGEFIISENKLVGKHAIIIPQEIAKDKLFIEVKAGGKSYYFSPGEKYTIAPSTKITYTLTIKRATSQGNIEATVADWENKSNLNGDLNEMEEKEEPGITNAYSITIPDFSESSVYKVMDGNTQIAEVCREYLKSTLIDNQAIVIYPFVNGKADLTKGYVAQILDGNAGNPISGNQHGGSISWDIANNTLTYIQGISPNSSTIYLDEKGKFGNSSAGSSKATNIIPDKIEDNRDGKYYPIVKVATQYWMGSNLETQTLTNGSTISNIIKNEDWEKAVSTSPKAAYSVNNANYYYTYTTLTNIAPQGWSVPTLNEWIKLKTYINDNISVITDESWDGGSNLTGLSIKAFGYRNTSGEYPTFTTKTTYYWHTEGGIKIVSGIGTDSSKKQGNSIRCIRK